MTSTTSTAAATTSSTAATTTSAGTSIPNTITMKINYPTTSSPQSCQTTSTAAATTSSTAATTTSAGTSIPNTITMKINYPTSSPQSCQTSSDSVNYSSTTLPTKDELKKSYKSWENKRVHKKQNSKTSRTDYKWKASYNPHWKQQYPWIEEIHDGCTVIGVVCTVCRTAYNRSPGLFDSYNYKNTDGLWVTRPLNKPWGSLLEECKEHEFGKKKNYNKKHTNETRKSKFYLLDEKKSTESLNSFRERVLKPECNFKLTEHLSYQSLAEEAARNDEGGGIIQLVNNMSAIDLPLQEKNLNALMTMIGIMLSFIKRRTSPQNHLREELELRYSLDRNAPVMTHLMSRNMKYHYNKAPQIAEFHTAIHLTVHLGIVIEMSKNLLDGQHPLFGMALDAGSRFNKAKSWIGYSIRYISDCEVVERVTGFKSTDRKTGEELIKVTQEMVDKFNEKTLLLKDYLGDKFPLSGSVPMLKLSHCTNLGVDGALISKKEMMNMRIRKFNPRAITHHCGAHKANLTVSHTVEGDDKYDFFTWGLDCHTKVHDLIKSSSRVRGLFIDIQKMTHEYKQFTENGRKLWVEFGDRPMWRWESERTSLGKMKKLLGSIESFLVTIQELKWSAEAKRKHLSHVPYLVKNIITCKFLIYSAVKLDLLDIIIPFIKILEKSDIDIMEYLDAVCRVRNRLESITRRIGGEHYREVEELLKDESFRLKHWAGVTEFRESVEVQQSFKAIVQGGCQSFLDSFNTMFDEESANKVQMFALLSMQKFRREVETLDDAEDFARKYRQLILEHFCNKVEFTARWKQPPDETNKTYVAEPLCNDDDLKHQITDFCLYVQTHFKGTNPITKKLYTTKNVLKLMIAENHPSVEQGSSFRIVIEYYLTQMISSVSVERLFSSFSYLDTAYNQSTTKENTEKLIMTYKEMPSELVKFDLRTAVTIWSKMVGRRTCIPPPVDVPVKHKQLIRPLSDIIKARNYKKKVQDKPQLMDEDTIDDINIDYEDSNLS